MLRESPELGQFALDGPCNSSFFPSGVFTTIQGRLCDLLPNIPAAEDYIGILNGLRDLQIGDLGLRVDNLGLSVT